MRPLQFGSNFVDPEAGVWTQKNVELRNEVRACEVMKQEKNILDGWPPKTLLGILYVDSISWRVSLNEMPHFLLTFC